MAKVTVPSQDGKIVEVELDPRGSSADAEWCGKHAPAKRSGVVMYKQMGGIKVGDSVRATGGKATVINGTVVKIDFYRGFLVADLDARVEPEWYSLSSLSKPN